MIDFEHEQVFPLQEAARRLPPRRGGKPTHVDSLFRWATTGLKGIRLETILVGGVRCTSMAALSRFFAAQTELRDGRQAVAAPPPTATARRRASEEAERRLIAKGA
jgi:hypothetical protein